MPPVHSSLKMEASLLDSDVQGLLGTEDLCLRIDEQYAASVGCSDRSSVIVRTQIAARFRSPRLGAEEIRRELHILQILAG